MGARNHSCKVVAPRVLLGLLELGTVDLLEDHGRALLLPLDVLLLELEKLIVAVLLEPLRIIIHEVFMRRHGSACH
jgi:hypothetical protein